MGRQFDLRLNATNIYQGLDLWSGGAVSVPPGGVVDVTVIRRVPEEFQPVARFLDAVDGRKFYLERTFSLGDVLMLVPVVRLLRSNGRDVYIRTLPLYTEVLERLEVPWAEVRERTADPGILFDWVVERDHTDSVLRRLHRVAVYLRAVGVDEVAAEELSWDCRLERFPELPFEMEEQVVVVQGQGANERKQLPVATVEEIVRRLVREGLTVYYTGEPRELGCKGEGFKHLGFSLSMSQLFSLVARATLLVTMDSGPLWVSHFTKTPVVALLGPTSWEQRLTFHPLFPEGATSIQLNKIIGCDSCFETLRDCGREVRCLHLPAAEVAELVVDRVRRFSAE